MIEIDLDELEAALPRGRGDGARRGAKFFARATPVISDIGFQTPLPKQPRSTDSVNANLTDVG